MKTEKADQEASAYDELGNRGIDPDTIRRLKDILSSQKEVPVDEVGTVPDTGPGTPSNDDSRLPSSHAQSVIDEARKALKRAQDKDHQA